MKLKKLTATFGKLEKAVLTPGEGFTLVEAPTRGQIHLGRLPAGHVLRLSPPGPGQGGLYCREKPLPALVRAPMEGTIELTYQGRDLTLRRGPKGAAPGGPSPPCGPPPRSPWAS